MTYFFYFANKRAIYLDLHKYIRGTYLSQVIKTQKKIIYTVGNVLNIYIHSN